MNGGFNFKRREHAEAAIEAANERLNAPLRRLGVSSGQFDNETTMFWVTPDGAVAGGSIDAPVKFDAYVLEFDTNAESWARVQSSGSDAATLEVWNVGPPIADNADNLLPKLRAREDAFGVLWVELVREPIWIFVVKNDPAGAGDKDNVCSFIYDVYVPSNLNDPILTNVNPTSGDHLHNRHGVGRCIAAQSGDGFWDVNGNPIIASCNEVLATGVCPV